MNESNSYLIMVNALHSLGNRQELEILAWFAVDTSINYAWINIGYIWVFSCKQSDKILHEKDPCAFLSEFFLGKWRTCVEGKGLLLAESYDRKFIVTAMGLSE